MPRRTREILEAKLREQATLQALLQQQGQAINELIEAAAQSGELLAGHSAEDWARWGTVLTAMQEWLQVPIESIGATPAQVLLKRYVSQG